ncbi:MAG: 2TM domain-containing protein [Acidimicrobiia bacterium]|nr:2TM domain-containing protein [Acidimicrobiia bacterium]
MDDSTPPEAGSDQRYEEARRRVRKLREFYSNVAVFVVINLALFGINLVTLDPSAGGGWWFYWVTVFWGIGLVFHAINVFGDRWGQGWEQRKIQQYMADS